MDADGDNQTQLTNDPATDAVGNSGVKASYNIKLATK